MATGNTNITINFNIGGDFSEKIDKYVRKINAAQKVVAALRDSLESLASSGAKGFDSASITKSLESVKNVFSSFKNIRGEDLQKSIAALDPTKLREFSAALTVFQQALTTDLIGRVASFSSSLVGLSNAQKALDSTVLVQQITALSDALPRLKQAITSDNFKNFAADLKNLHVDTQNIQGIIKLGSALKAITNFGSSKTALTDLAAGIKSLGRIKETSGFTRNVENIVKAGAMLSKMEPIDFSKITNGLKDLTKVDLKKEEWDKVQGVAGQIKKAFAELKTVKIPNLVGFHEGVALLNESGAKLNDPHGLKTNVAEIKLALDQLSKVKMPNLGNLVKNLGKLSEESYDFDRIGKSVQSFKNTLGQLHGIQIPSLSGFAKGLVELKGVSGAEIQSIANTLKGVPESLAGWDKVKTPDLASFAKGLKELGSGTIDFKQVNENLKSLPNRLKKLGEIKAPDLSKFAKGLIDLSKPAVSAVKSAHAIDKVLEVLSKYKDAQLKVPSLANFAKGLRELSSFEGELESLRNKSKVIKTFLNEFREFGGLQLPNVQGIVNAIHKLSTAVPENAGITASKHINDIAASIKGLDNIRVPNLTGLTKAFSVLSNTNFEGLKTTNFRQNVGEIKWAIDELNKLGVKNLPNFKNLSDAFKDLSGDKAKGLNLLYFRNNVEEIKSAITKLQEVKSTKFPDLKNIAEGFRTLDTVVPKGQEIGNIGAFTHNIEQIRQGLVTLSGFHNISLPSLKNIAEGFRNLDTAIPKGQELGNINNFNVNIEKIRQGMLTLTGMHKISLPNLKNIADGFRNLDDIVPKGRSTTDIGAFAHNVEQIRQGLLTLTGLNRISLPNLKGVAQGFRELDQWLPKGKLSSDIGAFQENINRIRTALSTLSEFNKVSLPNLKGLADGFRSIDEVLPKGKLGTDIGRFEDNINRIKNALEAFRNFNISVPSIKGLADGFRSLDEALPKGKLAADIGQFEDNVRRIKSALEIFRNFNVSIPSIKGLADGFRSIDEVLPKGKSSTDIGKFEENVRKIKNALEIFKHLNVSIPNLKGLADGFRSLDEVLPKGKSSADVGKFEDNVRHIANTVGIFNNIPPVKQGGMPNLKNIADAFVILSSDKITNADTTRFHNSVEQIKRSIQSLAEVQKIRIPNLKNVTSGFKDLADDRLKGIGNLNFSQNIEKIKDAVKSLAEVQHIQLPNLKSLAQGFRELDNVIPKGKSNTDIGKFQSNIDAIKDSVIKLKDISNVKLPNIKNLAEGFKILNESTIKYGFNEAGSKYGARIKLAVEEIKTAFAGFDKVRLPNLKNVSDGFKILNETFVKYTTNTHTWQYGSNLQHITNDIKTAFAGFDKVRLPNLKNVSDGFKILNETFVKYGFNDAGSRYGARIRLVAEEIKTAFAGFDKIKIPNLKNVADGFKILNETFVKYSTSTNTWQRGSNLQHIADSIKVAFAEFDKVRIPNLKNVADGFKILNEATVKYGTDTFGGTSSWGANIHKVASAIKSAFAELSNMQLPNVKNVADGFKILNELTIKKNDKDHANLTANIHKLKQALSQLKDLDGTAFPNVKNISEGMQNLTKLGPLAKDLDSTFKTVAGALQHIHGIKIPKLKDFTDGFEQLKTIVSKSTGNMETSKFAQDMTALSTALSGFGKVTLPPNLSGFAKGIEAITKVNVALFSKQFNELMVAINSFKIDTNNAALNHFTSILTLAASAIQQINGKLNQAQSQFGSFGRSVDQVANPIDKLIERFKMFMQYRVISSIFSSITNQLRNMPSAIIEFEKGMYNIQSITGTTNESMSKLGDVIKHVAGNTKFSVQEIADGMTTIAQAGFTAGQSMQMIQSISNLATGTLSDMKTTVDLATSAMVVFGIESHQAARVSDVFANAVNKSKLNMDKIKTAFNYIGPVARDANISFEETAVAMMLLANNGQKASTIGTGLRNIISTLLSPSKKLEAAASAAGVALADLDPRANSLRDVLSKLGIVVKDSQVALEVFGKRGATAVLGLTQSMGEYDRLYAAVGKVGTAAQMAAKQQEGLYVQWKNLKDRAQLAAVSIGEAGLTDAISVCVHAFSGLLNSFNLFVQNHKYWATFGVVATSVAAATVSIIGLGKAIMSLGKAAVVVELAAAFKALNKNLAISIGLLTTEQAAAREAAIASGAATATTKGFGAALWAVAKSPLFLVITAAVTAIGAGVALWRKHVERFEEALKRVGQEVDALGSSVRAYADFLQATINLKEGTDEYYNAMQRLLVSLKENKIATALAGKEYYNLLASVDTTKKSFIDGGKALQAYIDRLRELEHTTVDKQLKLLGERLRQSNSFMDKYGVREVKLSSYSSPASFNEWGAQIVEYFDASWRAMKRLNDEIAIGKVELTDGAKKFQEEFAEINEKVHGFLNLKMGSGLLNVNSTLQEVVLLAQNAEHEGTILNAVIEEFLEKQKAANDGIFRMNQAFADSYKNIDGLAELNDYLTRAADAVKAIEKTDLNMSGMEEALKYVREEAQAADETNKAYEKLQDTYKKLRKAQDEYNKALLHNNSAEEAKWLAKITEYEREYAKAKKESAEKAEKFLKIQTDLASKVANNELAILIRRFADEIALHDKHTEEINKQHEKRVADAREELKKREINSDQFHKKEQASLHLHNIQIENEEDRHNKTMEKLKANPISADQYLEKTLEAYKEHSDKVAIILQEELNNIHELEDAYIKSNKKIGLSFEDARRREQNAIAKAAEDRINYLKEYKNRMLEMYGNVEAAEQVEKIEQEIKKVQEDSLKKQHEIKEKYAKYGAMLIAQNAREIEAAAKRETEARKRAQEQALHDVALLEAKGVKSHEEAEREKTEITLKYIEEEIRAKQAQIAALSSSSAVKNIDQIQRLKEDIQKNTDEIVKIRRKGIEDQTKIIRDGIEKLRELQGSYDEAGAQLGDFSAGQQAKITQNYKEQLQRRKELGEENAKELESVQKESLSKVAQEIQRYCAKREDIQAKTTEKVASLEKDLAQKQEDFEKKKLDIVKKYNAKREDLQTSLQDKLHNIETSDMSGKRKEKADIKYARTKRNKAMSDMDEAIRSGDSQALDRIAKELENTMGAFENASKPKKYKNEIIDIYNALQKIIDAQEEIEKNEAERKNNQEVDTVQTKINSAMDAMQKSLAVEDERHTKAMTNLEREAEKIREQIRLAEQVVAVYTKSADQQTVFDQPPASAQQEQHRPMRNESSIPAREGTFDKEVQDKIAKGQAAAEAIKGAFTEATAAVQGAATQMAEGVVSAAGTAAEGVKTTVNNASTDFGLISKTIADTMSDGIRGATEGMDMAQKTMMAAAKTGLNTYQKEVEGTVVTVATNMSQAQIEAFQAAVPAMKAMAKRGVEEIAEDAGKTPIDLQFKTNAELVAQMAVDEVLAAKDKADSTLEAEPLVFATSVDKEAPVTDAIQLAEDISKRMSEIFEGQPPIVTPDVDTRGLEEMTQKANDTVQTISEEKPIDLTVRASEDAIQHTEQTIENLKESIVAKAAELGITLEGNSVAEVKSEAEKLISDIDNRKAKIKPELSQDDAEGVKYQLENLLKDLGEQEKILLQAQADKASLEAVHDVLKKLAKDISDKEQVLLKPGVDEAEKRRVLSEIADLYKEAQSKIEAIKITAQSDGVKKEIAQVEAMLKSMTREVTTKLKVDANSAIQSINNHINMLNKIPKEKVTVIKTIYKTEGKKAEASTGGYIEHLIPEYNKGGRVRRPEEPEQYADGGQTFRRLPSRYISRGSGHKDDVPALLMKNEFVHRAAAVKKYGLNFMYKLNNLEIPASITRMFADGGLVSNAITSIQKFATGGLVKSARRKLEDMFSGSGVNLNVDNLNVVGKLEQAADNYTSPIAVQAINTLAKNVEASISKFANGGILTSSLLTTTQMSTISAKYNALISEARREGNANIAKALSDEQEGIKKLTIELETTLKNLNTEYNKEVQKLTEAHTKRMSDKKAEYEKAMASANESYNKRVSEDNKRYAEEDEEYYANSAKRDKDYADANAKRDAEYNKSIAQLKKDYEKELADLAKTLQEKKDAARKEEEREAKEEAKTQKSYEKEDKSYAKETEDRKKTHDEGLANAKKEYDKEIEDKKKTHDEGIAEAKKEYDKEIEDRKKTRDEGLAEAKKEYEDAQFKYDTELETKKQDVDAKKAEIENFKNQMASRKFPANSKKMKEATVEEVIEAHVAQTKSENKGDEYIYAIDLGGIIKETEDNKGEPPTDAEIKRLRDAIRPYTTSERDHRNKLTTIANNPPYSMQAQRQLEDYNDHLNEITGYNAYERALRAKQLGVSIDNLDNAHKGPSKPRQSKPYREYLLSHYKTDYKQPHAQAQKDLDDFLKEDSPKVAYDKKVEELEQAYKEDSPKVAYDQKVAELEQAYKDDSPKVAYDTTVAELEQSYIEEEQRAKESRAEVMEQRKEHAEQLAETRANRAEELRQAQLEYDEGVKAAKENYNTSYKELTDTYKTEKAEAEAEYKESKATAEKERKESLIDRQNSIAERDKEYSDDVAERKREYDEYVSENNASYAEDMSAAKENYQSNVADAKAKYEEDVASLKESTKSEVEGIKSGMNDSISRAQDDMQEEFKSQEDAARQALEDKKNSYNTAQKEAEQTLVDSIENPSTTVAAQEAVEKATEQMSEDAVLQKYGMSVEELIKRLSKGLWKFATGGLVPSTATSKPNTDSVLSLLMPNEFVMSAKAVRAFGVDFMHSINNLRLPAFALGGSVGAANNVSPEIRSFKAGEMAVNKTIHALDLTINNTHIGELTGERNVIDRFIGEMQRAKMSLGALA